MRSINWISYSRSNNGNRAFERGEVLHFLTPSKSSIASFHYRTWIIERLFEGSDEMTHVRLKSAIDPGLTKLVSLAVLEGERIARIVPALDEGAKPAAKRIFPIGASHGSRLMIPESS